MDYMQHALSLASLALGHASPNPAVGAVIVKDDKVVGEGYTQPPGSHHAEIVALQQAREKASRATMYVTLEPCCYQGRTPPCTQAIIAAGIAEVHMAMIDPNNRVSGRGQSELRAAGIRTILGEHEEEAQELNEAYVKFVSSGLPFVIGKYAMSLDGKIATKTGDSKWISGEESRRYVHCLRHQVDAIMVES
ncbi:MAG: bifunctional diaminohydroxyphosphoribosylaminopyrimidine deaminase/5-amino-6-(5-phosphoribosylamino)uracil reductase RibD [Chloroflexi bacterium]|nr:bifunctional diaminohydroxyphosphoribosylaminopyrimidine deaminase/5-amino-6-(5-phosphoribosylamino)uracil reductase RibD [Chloroflexota bacterium]